MLFILFIIILYLGLFFVDSYILFSIMRRHQSANLSYKQSILVLILISIVGVAGDVLLALSKLHFLIYVVAPLTMFGAFHWYFKKNSYGWRRSLSAFLIFMVLTTLVSAIVIIPTRLYIFEPFIVRGDAMRSHYESGDYLFVNKIDRYPGRGDTVIIRHGGPQSYGIKRIIGLPLEKVEIRTGNIFINGRELSESYVTGSTSGEISRSLSEQQYFVLNDNRDFLEDSRSFGPVSKSDIVGTVFLEIPKFLRNK